MCGSEMLRVCCAFALLCCSLEVRATDDNMRTDDENFIRYCVSETQNGLQDSDSDLDRKLQTVCQAKQRFSDCIAGPRQGGALLALIRYYRWQENEADVRLQICPNLQFVRLRELAQASERDNFAPCGAQVFKDCIASVPNPMQNVIRAMELFLTCVEEKKDTCSASLIQHFVNLAKEVRAVLSAEEPALV